jgi:hypothetical protein
MSHNKSLVRSGLIAISLLGTITLAATVPQAPRHKAAPAVQHTAKSGVRAELTPFASDPSAPIVRSSAPSNTGGIAGTCFTCTDTEGEPNGGCIDGYTDSFNGGCNSTPPVFSSLTLGGASVCGRSGTFNSPLGATRDTDWYQFNVPTTGPITAVVQADFPPLVGYLNAVCPATSFLFFTTGNACSATTLTATLTSGNYYLFVGPQVFSGVPCGSEYTVRVVAGAPVAGACCNGSACQNSNNFACAASGGTFLAGTPCAFGSYNATNCTNALEDISTSGTLSTASGTDDGSQAGVPIGFSFPFYGNNFTSLEINNNGFLSFNTNGDGFFTNAPIPTAGAPDNLIAPLWDDLYTVNQGSVRYASLTGPSRFVVQWTNTQRYPGVGTGNTFQAILYATGDIEFRYGVLEGGGVLTPSVGVENADASAGTSIDPTTLGTGNTCRHLTFVPPGSNPCVSTGCTGNVVNSGSSANRIDVDDLLFIISNWGPCPAPPAPCPANIVNTGTSINRVDVDDLLFIISHWGPCPVG